MTDRTRCRCPKPDRKDLQSKNGSPAVTLRVANRNPSNASQVPFRHPIFTELQKLLALTSAGGCGLLSEQTRARRRRSGIAKSAERGPVNAAERRPSEGIGLSLALLRLAKDRRLIARLRT